MAAVLIPVIILATVALIYFKGTFVKSFALLISVCCAAAAAFGFFESLAGLLIAKQIIVPWAYTASLLALFAVILTVLMIIVNKAIFYSVKLDFLPETIGKVVCSAIAGFIITGFVLSALALAPLANNSPYQRFSPTNPDPLKPKKSLLNADGLATGLFGTLSKGSFSGKKSFAVLHPSFLNQAYLNRLKKNISVNISSQGLELPGKAGIWPASKELKDNANKPVTSKSGNKLTIARIGIKKNAIKEAGTFTLSQLRLVCKKKPKKTFTGSAQNVYPIGYLRSATVLQRKKLNDTIELNADDFDGKTRFIDFCFDVPGDLTPVFAQFKQNNIAAVSAAVTLAEAPEVATFIPQAKCGKIAAKVKPADAARIYGVEIAAEGKLLDGFTLEFKDPNGWAKYQSSDSVTPAKFEGGFITFANSKLLMGPEDEDEKEEETPAAQQQTRRRRRPGPRTRRTRRAVDKKTSLSEMLKPMEGYKFISLKCNNPEAGNTISGDELPVLIDVNGKTHHPVGIAASAPDVNDQTLYEVDYCSVAAKDTGGCLVLAEDGIVAKAFPEKIWIAEKAKEISQFHVLYMLKTETPVFITAVKSANAPEVGFEECEAFYLK